MSISSLKELQYFIMTIKCYYSYKYLVKMSSNYLMTLDTQKNTHC